MLTNSSLHIDLCLKYLEYVTYSVDSVGKGSASDTKSDSVVHSSHKSHRPRNSTDRSLLILLHGRGANETDLFDFAPLLDERFIVLSVRAPLELGKIAFAWFKTQYLETGPVHDVSQAEEAIQTFIQFVGEAQKKYGVAAKKTVLFGFSQGAILSQAIAIQHWRLIGGVVALSGRILPEHAQFSKVSTDVPVRVKNFPIFLSHGEYDEVLKIDYARSSRELFSSLDFDLTYREYPTGHGISEQNFSDAKQWLFNWLGTGL